MTTFEILRHIRNFYPDMDHLFYGDATIEDGRLQVDFLNDGQFYLIEKSKYNDGVYEYPTEALRDETFHGYITPLCLPPDLIELIREIKEWDSKNSKVLQSPFMSESFGGYSYSKANGNNGIIDWQTAFASRLRAYKKM